jgi:hypothetical protein
MRLASAQLVKWQEWDYEPRCEVLARPAPTGDGFAAIEVLGGGSTPTLRIRLQNSTDVPAVPVDFPLA